MLGTIEGITEGKIVGAVDGYSGKTDGKILGAIVGLIDVDGFIDEITVGLFDGLIDGYRVGLPVR